jgi:hypothetical protein
MVSRQRPQLIEPGPQETIDRDQSEPTWPLAAKNMQLMTESEVLQFQNGPTAETAGNSRDDGTRMFKHTQNTMVVNPKTLDFPQLSEFLVGTGRPWGLHLGKRLGPQAHALHSSPQPTRRAYQMDLPLLCGS